MKILYVEDNDEDRTLIANFLRKYSKLNIIDTESPIKAIEIFKNEMIDLVISDFRMPELDGNELLTQLKKINPTINFIVTTGYGDLDTAIKTIKNGAREFLTKPISTKVLTNVISEIEKDLFIESNLEKIKKAEQERLLQTNRVNFPNIIGKSKLLKDILSRIQMIANQTIPVTIVGNSGTGKEVIADMIQSLSDRNSRPYIKVNCAAIPENLFESELFGYEKGSFTGAIAKNIGKIESADTGTIFFDEICELPRNMQVKLLRFLQNGEIQRIGSSKTKKVDVRVIFATNRDIETLVKEDKFREDLYFRINKVMFKIPPLKERKEDIPLLVDYFLKKYSKELKIEVKKTFTREAMDKLIKYDFPGNIRELEGFIQHSLLFSMGEMILPEDIPIVMKVIDEQNSLNPDDKSVSLKDYIESIEKEVILKELKRCKWNQTQVSTNLQISEFTLRYKMKKYEIKNNSSNN